MSGGVVAAWYFLRQKEQRERDQREEIVRRSRTTSNGTNGLAANSYPPIPQRVPVRNAPVPITDIPEKRSGRRRFRNISLIALAGLALAGGVLKYITTTKEREWLRALDEKAYTVLPDCFGSERYNFDGKSIYVNCEYEKSSVFLRRCLKIEVNNQMAFLSYGWDRGYMKGSGLNFLIGGPNGDARRLRAVEFRIPNESWVEYEKKDLKDFSQFERQYTELIDRIAREKQLAKTDLDKRVGVK